MDMGLRLDSYIIVQGNQVMDGSGTYEGHMSKG